MVQTSHTNLDLFVHFLNRILEVFLSFVMQTFLLVCPQSSKCENPVLSRDVNQQKNLAWQ